MDPAEAAPLMCAGVTVFSAAPLTFLCNFTSDRAIADALRRVNIQAGEYLAVQGIGCVTLYPVPQIPRLNCSHSGLGHLVLQFAREMGFRPVALSSGPEKESLARKLGVEVYLDGLRVDQAEELRKLGGAKVIVCTASAPELMPKLIPSLAIDGTLLLLTIDDRHISISPCKF